MSKAAKDKRKFRCYAIQLAQDEKHRFDRLLVAAELAAQRFGSKRNAILQFCEESPTYREFAGKAEPFLPLPDPPKRARS